ncbi:hypothetical protein [Metapseudomonas otitidis]|uniref:hypothetical protein n=1 Tax=Metapseudomonas otitidis TaxID=319939 RepID=UPI00209AFDBD|nr:hypothetical protein [Pseudomonas otitidis]MCO7557812.1 hypothetical protein [Pseudomonas otitidis]
MTKTTTTQKLIDRIVTAGSDLVHAERALKSAREEIRAMYDTYFRAHGRPEGNFNPYAEAFRGVVEFTAAANERRDLARRQVYNARRRLESAVRAMERAK